MNCSLLEKEQKNRFGEIYKQGQLPIILEIEHSVFGSDYGANSWTTRRQADEIARLLNLQSHHDLLDLGSGSGILAIAALKYGSDYVTAIEYDEDCRDNFLDNMRIIF